MDVYQILMQDHRTVEQIFIEIEQTDDREVERREQLFGKLRVALEDHTVVEENYFTRRLINIRLLRNWSLKRMTNTQNLTKHCRKYLSCRAIKPTGWK